MEAIGPEEPEARIIAEDFFAGETAGAVFHRFLADRPDQITALHLKNENGAPTMYLDVKTRSGSRRIRLRRRDGIGPSVIEADSEIAYKNSMVVTQMVLMFTSGPDLRYRLRTRNEFGLELFAEAKTGALHHEDDFHALIIHLADLAERLETV